MQKYRQQKLKKIICNQCGKEIPVVHDVPREDTLAIEKRWGYFSDKDNEVHTFDLCEECYDRLVQGFLIPPEKKR